MTESTTNHARGIRVERYNNEEAVQQSPCGRDEPPSDSDRHVGTNDCSNHRSGWGNVRPEAVLSRWRLIALGEEIAEANSEESEQQW